MMVVAVAMLAAGAGDTEGIRSSSRDFSSAVWKPQTQAFKALFTSDADYRDSTGTLKGPDALASLFTNQFWSERTPPILREESIRFVRTSTFL